MAKPDTLIVDGHGFSWQRLCELRRQRLEEWKAAQPSQTPLFALKTIAARRRSVQHPGAIRSRRCLLK